MKSNSNIFKLRPSLDLNEVITIGGRLNNSSLTCEIKFPIILPNKDHVTEFIVKYFHVKNGHLGLNTVLSHIREILDCRC